MRKIFFQVVISHNNCPSLYLLYLLNGSLSVCICLSCLLYKHVAMDGFSSALGSQGKLSSRGGRRRRQARVFRPTRDHPEMVAVSGRQVQQKEDLPAGLSIVWSCWIFCIQWFLSFAVLNALGRSKQLRNTHTELLLTNMSKSWKSLSQLIIDCY